MRRWAKRVRYWLTECAAAAVATWVAAETVPAFRVDGAPVTKALTFLLIGAVYVVTFELLPRPLATALEWLAPRIEDLLDDVGYDVFWIALSAAWSAVGLLIYAAVLVVVPPVAFWLAAAATRSGLPVDLAGFWATVAAGLVVQAARDWVAAPRQWLTGPWRLVKAMQSVLRLLVPLAGIAAAVAVLPGVRLDPGPWTRQLLTLVVLTMLFCLVLTFVEVPYVTTALRVVGNGVKLWAVAWISGWMVLPLHINGFWSLVAAALVVTAVNWFRRFVTPPRLPPPPLPPSDPLWPNAWSTIGTFR